jgi:predicted nucleic acid-binding protein
MILVDTSVWIDHLNNDPTDQVLQLRELILTTPAMVLVGDLVFCEVLQGLSNDFESKRVEVALRHFNMVSMLTPDMAVRAAANYRLLRAKGVTVRKTIDVIIGTFCIEHDYVLLHDDRDFEPMRKYLGLRTL